MDQHAGALDVAEELVAQPDAAVGPLDEAGQVRQHEGALAADRHQAEIGVLGGEGIIGDLRLGVRQAAEQGGLAGIGQADQPRVGDDLQLQHNPALLAGGAGLHLARGAVGGAGESPVAPAAPAAAGDDDFLAGCRQVAEDIAAVAVVDEGARRDTDDQGTGAAAVAVVGAAAPAGFGNPVLAVDDLGEAVSAGHGADDDVAAVAAVAAVGPATRHVLLAPEAAAAGAAVPSLDIESYPIHESHVARRNSTERFPPPSCGRESKPDRLSA